MLCISDLCSLNSCCVFSILYGKYVHLEKNIVVGTLKITYIRFTCRIHIQLNKLYFIIAITIYNKFTQQRVYTLNFL